MVNMGHTPSIASMTTDGLLPLTHIVFEWIGGACSFSYHHPFVHRFVTLRLFVKGSLGCRLKTVFFTLFEILAICTSLRFPGHRVVVCLQHLVNERSRFRSQFCPPTILIAR